MRRLAALAAPLVLLAGSGRAAAPAADAELARTILADADLPLALERARALLKSGFNAGSGYGEVWIRDFNTFIDLALTVNDPATIRAQLLPFFRFQGPDGDIVDGVIPAARADVGYDYRRSDLEPGLLAHKNTVETDQESSLVLAVARYVAGTGDAAFLDEAIAGRTVRDRLRQALEYVHRHRFAASHGLVWGATTIDWGDVQPEHVWGVEWDAESHPAIDVYDNALYLTAIDAFVGLPGTSASDRASWSRLAGSIRKNVRKHLWDAKRTKFRPHVYLDRGSPFPAGFDEERIHYHGGTTVAMEAGLLSDREVGVGLEQMRADRRAAGAGSIGLTIWPPYPEGFFRNPQVRPFGYQNGGDWTWFGGRTIQQLVRQGRVREAYEDARPMVARALRDGFVEWYDVYNRPQGSREFRGAAGTLGQAIVLLLAWAREHAFPAEEHLVDLVQPIVGTARKDQRIGAVNSGQTYPAVGLPFGMTHWTPQTQASEDKCVAPFYAQDERIQGIRASHWWSGSCTQDYGSATIAAVVGPLGAPAQGPGPFEAEARGSTFSRAEEVMTPAYYAVTLPDHGVRVEATGTARAGILRFTFLRGGEARLLVHANRKTRGAIEGGGVRVNADRRAIAVSNPVQRIYAGSGRPAGFSGHVVARLSSPFEAWGTWGAGGVREGSVEHRGQGDAFGGYARLRVQEGQVIVVRAGTSFTSAEAAERNLAAEIGDEGFDAVRARAEAAWEEALGRVRLRGGSREERQVFYTALYHALLQPRLFADADGAYPRFAAGQAIERASGFDYYDDFSLWDTFRAQHPLLVLLLAERVPHFVRSLLAKAEQGGFLPNFPAWNSYTTAMIGDHAASVIADAWVKGVRGFDGGAALDALVKNATTSPSAADYADGRGRRALPEYLALGYVPLEQEVAEAFHRREQVSRTLEYAYDDFAVAALARALGREDVAAAFARRAGNWRRVFDPTIGFVRGRHADGRWVEAFDPAAEQPWITEGTPWQYSFFVPHDVPGLIEAMGGREAFVSRLDRLFAEGRYWHGNEPSHHIAYLYGHAGAPWRTQEEVRRILASEYGLGPAGLKGNDDTGQMSAWYVFSAIGLYPVCPGVPQYAIGSPLFEEASLDVGGGRRFTVRAPGASAANLYVQSASLDGRPLERPFVDHADVARGAVLELRMGPRPNRDWGSSIATSARTTSRLRRFF